jgi:UDP-GlcNAc3NAcA epimerase
MKIVTVVGNRPQFIKAAAVSPRLRERHDEVLIHTGQHFDDDLSAVFFAELGLPAPGRELGIALGSNTSQTARMLNALESALAEEAPDAVLVYGDTNSTLAGALAGAQAGVPVAHVEAGMRSFDRSMPEELNRVLSDHAASLLLCSSEAAAANLRREGVAGTVEVVGDVMVDVALKVQPQARERLDLVRARGVEPGEYVLATAHRAGNVDDPVRLERLVNLLLQVPRPVVFALHPRTRRRLDAAGLLEVLERSDGVLLTPPLGYVELTALLRRSPEGGLPRRRAVHHAPRPHRMDRDRRARLEHADRPRRRRRAARARVTAAARAPAAVRGRSRRGTRRIRSYTASRMRRWPL